MLNLSSEKMLELAKIAEPGHGWYIRNGRVLCELPGTYDYDELYFDPSIDGSLGQRSQALRVIVAALKLSSAVHLYQYQLNYEFIVFDDGIEESLHTGWQPDLLTASAMALLADRGKGS